MISLKPFFEKLKSPGLFTKTYYLVLAAVIVFSTYHIVYARRIIPGARLGELRIGGMTYQEARKVLEDYEKSSNQSIALKYGNYEYEVEPSDLGLEYNIDATVSRAFEIGRTGNIYIDNKDKLAGLIKGIRSKAIYDIDDKALSDVFANVRGEINRSAQNAFFAVENGQLKIISSTGGRNVDDQGIYNTVVWALENLNFGEKEIPVEVSEPKIVQEDLQQVFDEVSKLVVRPLRVVYEDKVWRLTSDQLLKFLKFEKEYGKTKLAFDSVQFESFLNLLEQEINELPRGEVIEGGGGIVADFKIIREGRELDVKEFTERFKDAYFEGLAKVAAVVNKTGELGDISKYGIYALLGDGSSNFSGSANPRIHNLTLAAGRAGGVLVPPGKVYSFNDAVGEVSAATGYDTGWIIARGRTVLGEGGGVCQTSTTLFRAILNSGLPIVVRHPHDYRVGYYEIDKKVGFDASVYQPSLDFQFKNDTPNYILIQSSWNLPKQTLTFKIYGTPDGRTVEISEPVVTNLVAPPEALYQKDPTLLKGTIKQIDWSAWGANVSFTRLVKRGEKILQRDIFSSRYRPWQAVYLVGEKD